jgi:hypothetical protein
VVLVALLSCLLTPAVWADSVHLDASAGVNFSNLDSTGNSVFAVSFSYSATSLNPSDPSQILNTFSINPFVSLCQSNCQLAFSSNGLSDGQDYFIVDDNDQFPGVSATLQPANLINGAWVVALSANSSSYSFYFSTNNLVFQNVTFSGDFTDPNSSDPNNPTVENLSVSLPTSPDVSAVPEPSSVILISTGITALVTQFRKKKKAS